MMLVRALRRLLPAFGVFAFVAVVAPIVPRDNARDVQACAFVNPPTTYEGLEDRSLYMAAMDLAGNDMLFPGDKFFSQQHLEVGARNNRVPGDLYIPPTLLKAISWIESVATQGAPDLPFGAIGPALVSFDCGYGIAQVTSGMTAPLGEAGDVTDEQALTATHFAYNIGRGAAILADKWNSAPEARPISGIDTNSDPKLVENWYYAVWSYNGFTGPGANRSNHPLDPIYGSWPRTPYSCGPASDGLSHNRSLHPYQELVYGCMAHPPLVQGNQLWKPLEASLPDLNNPYWRRPLDLANFRYPYSGMDIPTAQPSHQDPTPKPTLVHRFAVLGIPNMVVDRPIVLVNVRPGESATPGEVRISNTGSGIVAWRVTANRSWVTVSQVAGIAVGENLPCLSSSPCDRTATLRISVDPDKVLGSDAAVVTIRGIGHGGRIQEIAVFVRANVAIGIPGTTRN
jgi:hypothetical protein